MDVPRYAPLMLTSDFEVEYGLMWAGESCSLVRDIRPAGEIVGELLREAGKTIAALTQS